MEEPHTEGSAPERPPDPAEHPAPERPRRVTELPVSKPVAAAVAAVLALVMLLIGYNLGASSRPARRPHYRTSVAPPPVSGGVVIPTHSPVPPRPRSDEPYAGLGTWVDIFDHSYWDDPAAAIAAMNAQGVRTLYLQTSNYTQHFDVYRPAALSAFIDAAHAAGMKIVAWYLPGLANIPLDLRRSLAAIDFKSSTGQTFDGFGLDIEAQIVDPPTARSQALLDLSQRIRSQAPLFPLAAITPSPVALQTPPNGWPKFPWDGLNQYYDAFVPMDYFASTARGPAEVQTYTALSAQIIRGATGDQSVPIAPIGGIAQAVSGEEAAGFTEAINQEGLLGGSLYDFRTTTDPAVWAALRQIGRPSPRPQASGTVLP